MTETKDEPTSIYAPIEEVPLQKFVIWGFILILLVALRPFYPLFFLTFVFAYIAHNVAEWLLPRLEHRYTRKRIIAYMFLLMILAWVAIGFLFVPRTITQAKGMFKQETINQITKNLQEMQKKPVLRWGFPKDYDFEEQVEMLREFAKPYAVKLVVNIFNIGVQFLLAILFSFLITFDIHRLGTELAKLRETRLHGLYDEVAPEASEFGHVMGRVFQAQAMIAVANTALTAVGMLLLGLDSVILLSIVVFICSFIPVVGVIISSVPMCLVSLSASGGGVGLMLGVVGMVCIVHAIEAYVLNPRIVGAHMKMNPIVVLGILLFSEHYFGLWGLILGVPICYYLFHYVLKEVIRKKAEPQAVPAAPPAPA
ncbi:MAG: AI-2E family transporter [Planctomycetota bacterium]|mgnify:CR=1 FL=1